MDVLRPSSAGLEAEEGPLWHTIKRQLYKPEVSHIKRIVGEPLIQQNKLMWEEIASLRAMLADFQEQNEQLAKGLKQHIDFRDTQHRDLLRRQAQIILEDLRSQASSCGYGLQDLVPELKNERLRDYIFKTKEMSVSKDLNRSGSLCLSSPPATPSTRPPSSVGGYSNPGYSSIGFGGYGAGDYSRSFTPEPFPLTPCSGGKQLSLPLGQPLGPDAMQEVALGIREALEAEQASLLAAINEEMQRLEAEEERRSERSMAVSSEPSTAELQQFLHRLQDIVVSPGMRALTLVAAHSCDCSPAEAVPIAGGSNVRRLQALISQRRKEMAPPPDVLLHVVPESANFMTAGKPLRGGSLKANQAFDPFFDDPFAS